MLDDRTDRSGVAYLFVNEEVLRELYKKVGFTIVALEEYMFTDNNRSIKNSWFHVTASR
ncbi:MAG: hypothetical protein J6O04_09810 [Selenomonadaceae bacterium]|nr:hypothetical protein [Selenomonadaceae bacterium]